MLDAFSLIARRGVLGGEALRGHLVSCFVPSLRCSPDTQLPTEGRYMIRPCTDGNVHYRNYHRIPH